MALGICLGVVFVLLVACIAIYNGLVTARQRVLESWSGVDTELSRRHDLIPNLVAAAKGYMSHERETFENLSRLRERAVELRPGPATPEQLQVESQIGGMLAGLRVRMEAYPELKAARNVGQLMAELANTEDRIQSALRYYNGNVRELNVRCEAFPSAIFAALFGFRPAVYFELKDPAAREAPPVAF